MTPENGSIQHCQLSNPVNLIDRLEATPIEHLFVDDTRTVVIYQGAIFILTVTDGTLTDATEFNVKLEEPSKHSPNHPPAEFIGPLVGELGN